MNIIIFFVMSGLFLSVLVYIDTKKHKQSMPIMGIIWSLTMLWASWIGLIAYIIFGRQNNEMKPMAMNDKMDMSNMKMSGMDMSDMDKSDTNMSDMNMPMDKENTHKWKGIALSTLHCGAGCVLADIVGESVSIILGLTLVVGWTLDYILALIFGVYFQYMAIKQMGSTKFIISKALKSDFFSLTSWQVGMYGAMGVYFLYFAESNTSKLSFEFWFVMQLAMMVGFICSYPMNILLIKKGIKHAM